MKRLFARILICIIAGAIINIAVAWGFARYYYMEDLLALGNVHPGRTQSGCPFTWTSAPGVRIWYTSSSFAMLPDASGDEVTVPCAVNDMLMSSDFPGLEKGFVGVSSGRVVAFGWPAQSICLFECHATGVRKGNGPRPEFHTSEYGIAVRPDASNGGDLILPVRPLWVAFTCNSTIYGCAIFLAAASRRHMVYLLRRWRGHCPRCKYELRHCLTAGCPECGWRRETTAASSNSS